MRYIYLVTVVVTSVLTIWRTIIYSQMNGYSYILKSGIGRELLVSIGISALVELISLALIWGLDDRIYYLITMPLLIVTGLILASRRYKVKPNYTNRLKRLIAVFLAINILLLGILLLITHYLISNIDFLLCVNTYYIVNHMILIVSIVITSPIESRRNRRYVNKCVKALHSYKNIKVIGITGSFGKTSLKCILGTILAKKYNVAITPESYNTPIGIAKSIEMLDGDEDYFVVEMGARHVGDISALCELVRPNYGIITGVTEQHLSTFKSVDNIVKTKYELYQCIINNGLCVFNGDNNYTVDMYNYTSSTNKILTHNNEYNVADIVMDESGTTFDLCIHGDSLRCHTCLYGKHNIDNILMASTLAYNLGMTIDEIASGIGDIRAIPHRFEVTSVGDMVVIDDSYNANIRGIEAGLDALKCFDGRKIVATQGIVEGGRDEKSLNINVGSLIANVADIAILIGRERRYIESGLEGTDFNMNNVFSVRTLDEAERIFSALLRRGDVLYITNDLPDNY